MQSKLCGAVRWAGGGGWSKFDGEKRKDQQLPTISLLIGSYITIYFIYYY